MNFIDAPRKTPKQPVAKRKTPPKEKTAKELVSSIKTRIDLTTQALEKSVAELETKANAAVAAMIAHNTQARKEAADVAADGTPAAKPFEQMSVWAFMQKCLLQREGESPGKHKKRSENTAEVFDLFINESLLSEDDTNRVSRWMHKTNLDSLDVVGECAGSLTEDGKVSLDAEINEVGDALKRAVGKLVLSCVVATPDIQLVIKKICKVHDSEEVDEERAEKYSVELCKLISADLLFGPPPAKKEKKPQEKKAKKSDEEEEEEEEEDDEDDEEEEDEDEEDDDEDEEEEEDERPAKKQKAEPESAVDEAPIEQPAATQAE